MRVLVSTADKTGLVEFLQPLNSLGLEIISTGGTYEFLKKNNFNVIEVSEVTGFPEVLDGRVKTLNPFIHMGLLADTSNRVHLEQLRQHKVSPFDLVVGNLYPFELVALKSEATDEELIENIDIGGPSFLRASAKNYRSVTVVCDSADYSWVQKKMLAGEMTEPDRKKLALKVFSLTSYYDALIVNRLQQGHEELPFLNLPLKRHQTLRYGENPHQRAEWYRNPLQRLNLSSLRLHQGKELSYNNILDLDAALNLVWQFSEPACVAVKHNNPCGVAVAKEPALSAAKCVESDSKSIFGGIIAFNRVVDLPSYQPLENIFLECVVAPGFTEDCLAAMAKKKNLRVLDGAQALSEPSALQLRSVCGGMLSQSPDQFLSSESWTKPDFVIPENIREDIHFGEKVVGALKSNAIAIVLNGQTVGLGMGQVNRVDAVEQALLRAQDFAIRTGCDLANSVLVSDAFFPFPDSIDRVAAAGIKWVAQPGGSLQDERVKAAASAQQIKMILTGRRHFKH